MHKQDRSDFTAQANGLGSPSTLKYRPYVPGQVYGYKPEQGSLTRALAAMACVVACCITIGLMLGARG